MAARTSFQPHQNSSSDEVSTRLFPIQLLYQYEAGMFLIHLGYLNLLISIKANFVAMRNKIPGR